MAKPYLIVEGSDRSRPLLRYKAAAMRRFKRAGIAMPDVKVYWTRRGNGTAYHRPDWKHQFFVTIPIFIREFLDARHPVAEKYLEYYIIHELCHIADVFNDAQGSPHGPSFHWIFAKVCPKMYWLFEQSYQSQFEERIESWGSYIPDRAFETPRLRHLEFIYQGIPITGFE